MAAKKAKRKKPVKCPICREPYPGMHDPKTGVNALGCHFVVPYREMSAEEAKKLYRAAEETAGRLLGIASGKARKKARSESSDMKPA